MNILIIGGTRNVGHFLTLELLNAGHNVTLLNRGKTSDHLPDEVERLRADRTDSFQLEKALIGREFDVVVDNALYKQQEAETIVRLLNGHVGHYIFLSSGQVYLVREGAERPFSEESYEGRLIPAPKANTFAYEEWQYGIDKRKAEDVVAKAGQEQGFPFTSLRLPMVNGERDHFSRLYGYVLRLKDGGPILVPETPDYALRHIYSHDVVKALLLAMKQPAKGRAYNISQDETTSLEEFLDIVGDLLGVQPQLIHFRRGLLEANGFLPDCSPFSERWMSELTNDRSKAELGMIYTPLRDYLSKIIAYYEANPQRDPVGYKRRHREIQFAQQTAAEK
ncbi:MAG: NAD-dependent epimerase/dehydratase family protein [Anaerolineaceae bacterium]|nr:NAD-dependent epimerase/dehydratase family protein [Anaerolineaceae bacterium]